MLATCEKAQQAVPFRWAHDIHGRAVGNDLVLRTRKVGQRRVSGSDKVFVVQGKMGTSPGPMQVAMSPNPEHNERGVMGGFMGQAASLCNG